VDYVYKVITDYRNAYRINPAITKVEILPSGRDDVVRVRNLSEQCVGPFCFDIAWAGDITETGNGDLEVKTLPGLSDFVSGSASWRIHPKGERTSVLYESKLKPAFFIPPVIGDIIIRNHIKNATLATFKRIECQAMLMLALDMENQPANLEQLSQEGKECLNPLG
jgi:Polyketide cyclase / dehydrase and lipid transport